MTKNNYIIIFLSAILIVAFSISSRADRLKDLLDDQGENIGLATIYRVLTQLEMAELIQKNNFNDNQSAYEIKKSHHDHLICTKCGEIIEFVNDDLVVSLVSKKIDSPECENGFILDGFPRNISQANNLDRMFEEKNLCLDHVILIDVPDEDLVARCTCLLYTSPSPRDS